MRVRRAALREPAAALPLAGLIERGVADAGVNNAGEQLGEAQEGDGLEDPAVEPGVHVGLAVALDQRGGDGDDGDAAVERGACGEAPRWVRLFVGPDHFGGCEAVDDGHLYGGGWVELWGGVLG